MPEAERAICERSVGLTSPRSGARKSGWVLGAVLFWLSPFVPDMDDELKLTP